MMMTPPPPPESALRDPNATGANRAALRDDPAEAQILRDQVASEVRRLQAKPAVQDDYDEAESILNLYLEVVSKWIQPPKAHQVAQVRAAETPYAWHLFVLSD